jgi:hypothetical protein
MAALFMPTEKRPVPLPNTLRLSSLSTMVDSDYKQLYRLLRQYQLELKPGGKTYNAADTVLTALFPYYYSQNREQSR